MRSVLTFIISCSCGIFATSVCAALPPTFGSPTKLVPTDPTIGKRFGGSVAISANSAVIGASEDRRNGTITGAAYIFESPSPGQWQQATKLVSANPIQSEGFGYAVALSGNT